MKLASDLLNFYGYTIEETGPKQSTLCYTSDYALRFQYIIIIYIEHG